MWTVVIYGAEKEWMRISFWKPETKKELRRRKYGIERYC
jgi:hypothetical protein